MRWGWIAYAHEAKRKRIQTVYIYDHGAGRKKDILCTFRCTTPVRNTYRCVYILRAVGMDLGALGMDLVGSV